MALFELKRGNFLHKTQPRQELRNGNLNRESSQLALFSLDGTPRSRNLLFRQSKRIRYFCLNPLYN